LTRKEEWKFAIIEDSLKCNGLPLLKAFIMQLVREHEVHILCFDRVPDARSYMPSAADTSIGLFVHDGCTDPSDWCDPPPNKHCLKYSSSLSDHLKSSVESSHSSVVIIIDSITTLLNHRPVTSLCRDIYQLLKLQTSNGKPPVLLGLLHSDVHDEHICRAVSYLASTTMSLTVQQQQLTCRSVHRRPSGKVLKEIETFALTDGYEVVALKKFEVQKKQATPEPNEQPDPTAGLTFKLTLEEKEKEDRSQLVLPYTRVKDAVTGGAQIFYEPDANDDFDEEDPDDDLNV